MTRKLEEVFDLPRIEELEEIVNENEEISSVEEPVRVEAALKAADKIDKALPLVTGLEGNDIDMDGYADQAMDSYKELMDLGMNVESRHAGDIFQAATKMMKNAIEAKVSKADKKLRMIDLQLRKMRLDQTSEKNSDGKLIEGDGYVIADRNELLKKFLEK